MLNQSFLANGSVFFFRPFLPLDNLLFFPTAIMAVDAGKARDCAWLSVSMSCVRLSELLVRKC